MSANPRYTFDLVDSSTMASLDGLQESTSRVFNPVFNKPGNYRWDLPLDGRAAYLVKRRRTGVLVSRNAKPIWSGGITSVNKDALNNKMSCVATGWLEEYDHRHVRKAEEASLIFASPGTVGGSIMGTLITTCNAQTDSLGNVRPLHVVFGQALDTQLRTRTYRVGDNYGSIMRELVEIENGCDIQVDPLTRTLTTVAPTSYADQVGAQYGYGIKPDNLANATETGDGTTIYNRENAVGSNGAVYSFDDQTAINDAGVMLEEWLSLSDVSDPTIVAAYANAELVYKRYGTITYGLTVASYGDIPRLYDDFYLGDKIYFSVNKGAFQLSGQAVRVFGATININDNGDEIISELQTSP